jgi:ribokinase
MTTPRLCVVGSANMDLTFRAERMPRPGETLSGRAFQAGFGGKGANQAVMAARLDAGVCMIACVGHDPFGAQIVQNFKDHAIETTHVASDPSSPTGTAAIVVDDSGENCIIVVPGANLALTSDHVRAAAPAIQGADVVLGQLEVSLDATLEAFRLARANGVRTILNPAPARSLPAELLALTELCVPNETEAAALTAGPVETLDQARAAARRLRVPALIVTLGQRGAFLVSEESAVHVPGVPVTAVDSSGAGDAFIGSLAVFWAGGMSLLESVRRANAVAALSVTRPGTQASFPNLEEAKAVLIS